jgi:hypothetical protein
MLGGDLLLVAAVLLHAATPAPPAEQNVYRIDMSGNQTVWSEDRPKDTGAMLLFHRYPGGMLVSVKKANVVRIVVSRRSAPAVRGRRPFNAIDLGLSGPGAGAATGDAAADATSPPLGARKDGTALLNPDRPYRPDWDTKQVPGLNLPYPNSPNDYREGRTMAYPPGNAVQEAPGEPPKMAPSSGEPPKAPGN